VLLIGYIAIGISEKTIPLPVLVNGSLQSGSPTNDQLKVNLVSIPKNIPVAAPTVEDESLVDGAKIAQKLLLSPAIGHDPATEIVRLASPNYVGMSRQYHVLRWSGNPFEGSRFEPSAFYDLKIAGWCLSAICESDPGLYGSIISDVELPFRRAEVCAELLFGCVARQIKSLFGGGCVVGGSFSKILKVLSMFGHEPRLVSNKYERWDAQYEEPPLRGCVPVWRLRPGGRCVWAGCFIVYKRDGWRGLDIGIVLGEIGTLIFLTGIDRHCQKCENSQPFQHNSTIVPQKPIDIFYLLGYIYYSRYSGNS